MGIIDKLFRKQQRIVGEGSWRGPFSGEGEFGGWHTIDPKGDGWQRNLDITSSTARNVPAVYACVMTIARSMSQCYPQHIRETGDDIKQVKTSAAYRMLRNPNAYQSGPEFILNTIATALFEGEAFAIVTRNDRSEIDSMHLLPKGSCSPFIDDETKEIFYSVGENPLAPGGVEMMVPARDILHVKFHTPRHPLIGESPIKAAAMSIGINVALSQNQAAFFNRMNRPSGILSTDMNLNAAQMQQLRAAFENQSKMWAAGGMPILGNGIKFQPMSISSQDAQVVQAQRMTVEDVCRAFGVPPPLIGDLSHATLNNTETLISHFLSMSLGSYLEMFERQLDRLFRLPATEYIELDTAALLRTNYSDKIDGLTKSLQGGLITPNEARAKEGLPPIAGGDSAFMQRQMTAIDMLSELNQADLDSKNNPPQPVAAIEPPKDDIPMEEGKDLDPDIVKSLVEYRMKRKRAS